MFLSLLRCLDRECWQKEIKTFHIYHGDDAERSLVTEGLVIVAKLRGGVCDNVRSENTDHVGHLQVWQSECDGKQRFSIFFVAHVFQVTSWVALCNGHLIHRRVFSHRKGTRFFVFMSLSEAAVPASITVLSRCYDVQRMKTRIFCARACCPLQAAAVSFALVDFWCVFDAALVSLQTLSESNLGVLPF